MRDVPGAQVTIGANLFNSPTPLFSGRIFSMVLQSGRQNRSARIDVLWFKTCEQGPLRISQPVTLGYLIGRLLGPIYRSRNPLPPLKLFCGVRTGACLCCMNVRCQSGGRPGYRGWQMEAVHAFLLVAMG